MRVLTWNVRSLRDDRSRIVTTLRELRPDVVCLQEAPRWLRSRTRLAALARESGLLFVCGGRASAGTAVLVAMRVPVDRSTEVRFPPLRRLHRRGLAAVSVSTTGGTVAVGSVHLGLDGAQRLDHASRIRGLLGRGQPDGVVVAGDLNEGPGRPAWSLLSDGLVDVAAASGTDHATFPAQQPRVRIDAVFVSPGIPARAVDPVRVGLEEASDHLPVVVDLQVEPVTRAT
jgi:endonuclease/exonuclease/phosphatase family metal-dependent hydrolase